MFHLDTEQHDLLHKMFDREICYWEEDISLLNDMMTACNTSTWHLIFLASAQNNPNVEDYGHMLRFIVWRCFWWLIKVISNRKKMLITFWTLSNTFSLIFRNFKCFPFFSKHVIYLWQWRAKSHINPLILISTANNCKSEEAKLIVRFVSTTLTLVNQTSFSILASSSSNRKSESFGAVQWNNRERLRRETSFFVSILFWSELSVSIWFWQILHIIFKVHYRKRSFNVNCRFVNFLFQRWRQLST